MSTHVSFRPEAVRRFLASLKTEDREVLERALDEIDSGALKYHEIDVSGEPVASWDMYVYSIFDGAEFRFHFVLPGAARQAMLHPDEAAGRLDARRPTPSEARRHCDRLREYLASEIDTVVFLAIGRDRPGEDASVLFWHHPSLRYRPARTLMKAALLDMAAQARGKN